MSNQWNCIVEHQMSTPIFANMKEERSYLYFILNGNNGIVIRIARGCLITFEVGEQSPTMLLSWDHTRSKLKSNKPVPR